MLLNASSGSGPLNGNDDDFERIEILDRIGPIPKKLAQSLANGDWPAFEQILVGMDDDVLSIDASPATWSDVIMFLRHCTRNVRDTPHYESQFTELIGLQSTVTLIAIRVFGEENATTRVQRADLDELLGATVEHGVDSKSLAAAVCAEHFSATGCKCFLLEEPKLAAHWLKKAAETRFDGSTVADPFAPWQGKDSDPVIVLRAVHWLKTCAELGIASASRLYSQLEQERAKSEFNGSG